MNYLPCLLTNLARGKVRIEAAVLHGNSGLYMDKLQEYAAN